MTSDGEQWVKLLTNMYKENKIETLETISNDLLDALKELRENEGSIIAQKRADFMIDYVGGFLDGIDE